MPVFTNNTNRLLMSVEELVSAVEQMKVDPGVRNLLWLRPEDIKFENIDISSPKNMKFGNKIRNLLYSYPQGKMDLAITPPLDDPSLLICNSIYPQKLEDGVDGKHICRLDLDLQNESHRVLIDCFERLRGLSEGLLQKVPNSLPVSLPIVKSEDGLRAYLFAELIESAAGAIFTQVYDDNGSVDIKTIKQARVRPMFIFSNTEKPKIKGSTNMGTKLKIKVSQMYVHDMGTPLAKYNRSPLLD